MKIHGIVNDKPQPSRTRRTQRNKKNKKKKWRMEGFCQFQESGRRDLSQKRTFSFHIELPFPSIAHVKPSTSFCKKFSPMCRTIVQQLHSFLFSSRFLPFSNTIILSNCLMETPEKQNLVIKKSENKKHEKKVKNSLIFWRRRD